jgi:hypothetical protein
MMKRTHPFKDIIDEAVENSHRLVRDTGIGAGLLVALGRKGLDLEVFLAALELSAGASKRAAVLRTTKGMLREGVDNGWWWAIATFVASATMSALWA